jgi:hypothetical protein
MFNSIFFFFTIKNKELKWQSSTTALLVILFKVKSNSINPFFLDKKSWYECIANTCTSIKYINKNRPQVCSLKKKNTYIIYILNYLKAFTNYSNWNSRINKHNAKEPWIVVLFHWDFCQIRLKQWQKNLG